MKLLLSYIMIKSHRLEIPVKERLSFRDTNDLAFEVSRPSPRDTASKAFSSLQSSTSASPEH